jgi:sugar lactone lactonase YvrE
MGRHLRQLGVAVLLLASVNACRRGNEAAGATLATLDSTVTPFLPGATRVATIIDLHSPESARYDPDQDVFFVSNMFGYGSVKDGNGYVDRVSAQDPSHVDHFIQSGVAGATLDAPKGMALHGDTLWIADIDKLRGFHRVTGAPLATIDLAPQGAVLLNDVVVPPDGKIYVTDSGIIMSDKGVIYDGGEKIFVIGASRSITIADSGKKLGYPNGITWDARGRRLLLVNFDPFSSQVVAMQPGDTTRKQLAQGKGRFDGVEVLSDGSVLYTAWSDSSVHLVNGDGDHRIIRPVPGPADIGVDTKRSRVAVPVSAGDRLEIWQLPAAWRPD